MRRVHRFVREPETLLAAPETRPAGSPVMLELGGMVVPVTGIAGSAGGVARELYGGRSAVAAKEPAALLSAIPLDSSRFLEAADIDWDPYLAVDYRPEFVCAAGYRWLLRIRRGRPPEATLWFDRRARGSVAEDLWENALRILLAYALLEGGGLLVHSAGIVLEGRGFLFPGASGDGKSSVAGVCQREGALVLSDDCNALLPGGGDDGWRIAGLPFGGEYHPRRQVPGSFPVAALLALAQAGETRVRPLGPGAAAGRLLRAAPFVNGDPVAAPLLVRRCAAVTESLRCGKLGFTLDGGVVDALSEFAGAGDASEPGEQ